MELGNVINLLSALRVNSFSSLFDFPPLMYFLCTLFFFSPSPNSAQVIRDVLLLGHRQAFAWVDEWIGKCLIIEGDGS